MAEGFVPAGNPRTLRTKRGRVFSVAIDVETLVSTNPDVYVVADLSGYSVSAWVRRWTDTGEQLVALTAVITVPSAGEITLSLTSIQTAALERNGYYDVKLTQPNGEPLDLIDGPFIVEGQVTP